MKNWNVLVTAQPGWGRELHLLRALNLLGEFHPTQFKDVCTGRVEDVTRFLDALLRAREANERWTRDLARVIPVERTFRFAPEDLATQLKQAVAPFAQRMAGGSFHVRLERRGLIGQVTSPEVEREVADHLFALLEDRGKDLHASFREPDYIVAAETLDDECGVALLTREVMERYPFVQAR